MRSSRPGEQPHQDAETGAVDERHVTEIQKDVRLNGKQFLHVRLQRGGVAALDDPSNARHDRDVTERATLLTTTT